MKISSLMMAAAVVLSFSSQVYAADIPGQKPDPTPPNKCAKCMISFLQTCTKNGPACILEGSDNCKVECNI